MTQRKYNGKADSVAIYHIHNKEWRKDPTIQKLKNKNNTKQYIYS